MKPRMTWHIVQILKVLLQTPNDERWGNDIVAQTGFRQSTVQPILLRLERAGILSTRWEAASAPLGRPNRRYVRLTEEGRQVAELEVARDPSPPLNLNTTPELTAKIVILAAALHEAGVGLTEHEVDGRELIAERLPRESLDMIAGWIGRANRP